MAFLDFVAEKESHCQHEKFYGNYRGVVVDNVDPLKNGRCKINVFGVYDELEEDHLPWATFADPFMGGLEGFGSSFIPEVDTHVWVFFEGGDVRFPTYFAGAPAMNGVEAPDMPSESRSDEREASHYPEDNKPSYPHNKVIRFKSGMGVEFDQTEGAERLRLFHPSGWEMIVNASGSQREYVPENWDIQIDGDVNVRVEGHTTWSGPSMDLGEDSDLEPSVLGDKLAAWIASELTPWLDSHQHIGNLGAPTSAALSAPFGPFQAGSGLSGGAVYSKKNRNQ